MPESEPRRSADGTPTFRGENEMSVARRKQAFKDWKRHAAEVDKRRRHAEADAILSNALSNETTMKKWRDDMMKPLTPEESAEAQRRFEERWQKIFEPTPGATR